MYDEMFYLYIALQGIHAKSITFLSLLLLSSAITSLSTDQNEQSAIPSSTVGLFCSGGLLHVCTY